MKRESTSRRLWLHAMVLALCCVASVTAFAQDEAGEPDDPAAAVPDSLAAATAPVDTLAVAVDDSMTVPEPRPASELPDLWSTGASPLAAVLVSPVFPGWGQLYTEGSWRSALAFGSQWWFWSRMITRDRRAVRARHFAATFEVDSVNYTGYNAVAEENWEQMRDYAWWSGASLFIIALDAYVGAHLFHFDDDPVPVPNRFDEMFGRPGGEMPGSYGAPQVVVFRWGQRF